MDNAQYASTNRFYVTAIHFKCNFIAVYSYIDLPILELSYEDNNNYNNQTISEGT